MRSCFTSPVLLSLLASAPAAAQVSPPSGPSAELLTSETRRRVTDEVKKFLEERCPQQCDIGEVNVKVARRKPPVGATPGFEELSPDVKDHVVERVDVSLLLDKRLTNDFRSGVRTILAKKLEAEGMSSVMHELLIHFPTPQDLPEKTPLQPQYPAPPQAKAEPDKKADAPLAPQWLPQPERSIWERLAENLPLLIGLLLCAAIVWFTLRQYQRILEARTDVKKEAELAALRRQEEARGQPGGVSLETRRENERAVDALRSKLVANRALGRAVMRDLVTSGAPSDTALAVALLGPSLLDGVRGDPECRAGLTAIDDYLAERAPDDGAEARRRLVADLERRVLRIQVAQGAEPAESAFAYLRDVSPALFARLLAGEPPETQALILRHAPQNLMTAFLERQPATVRERLVLPLLEQAAAPREEVSALATHFREKLSGHLVVEHGDGQPDPIGDILQGATREERLRLLGSLRGDAEALRRALGSFLADETLQTLDAEVLATAMARLDPATAALFAGSLDEVGRKRLYASLPAVTARALAEEADVLIVSSAGRTAARRAALQVIRRTVEERGLDLAEMNRRALSGTKEVAS